MARSKEELRTNRSVPQPGLTPDEPERVSDHGSCDAPRVSVVFFFLFWWVW